MQPAVENVSAAGKLFGERIKKCRKALGLKQQAVGLAVGCSTSTISEIESGKHTPHLDKALALARFFGVPVEELVMEESQEEMAPWMGTLRHMIETIPFDHRESMAAMLEALAAELKSSTQRRAVVAQLAPLAFFRFDRAMAAL